MPPLLKRLLRLPAVLELTQTCKSKAYADIANGRFPAPIKHGRSSYWIADEIAAWQAERVAERDTKLKGKLQPKSKAA